MSRNRKSGDPAPRPEPKRYELKLKPAAEHGLSKLTGDDLRKVVARLRALVENPRPPGSIKLQGGGDLYRIRSGDYRIIYEIEDDRSVVRVVSVGNRRDIYRDL